MTARVLSSSSLKRKRTWPEWWYWELDITDHALFRMDECSMVRNRRTKPRNRITRDRHALSGPLMIGASLQVTFREGRPWAAYYHLQRPLGTRRAQTIEIEEGLVADLDQRGKPIRIEIVHPCKESALALNRALAKFKLPTLSKEELRPLHEHSTLRLRRSTRRVPAAA